MLLELEYITGGYRFGFNGKEKDDEVFGSIGTFYDYGFRVYDARIAKFLSVDPLTKSYPWYTPYQFAGNKPIWAVDLDGLEEIYFTDIARIDEFQAAFKVMIHTEIGFEVAGIIYSSGNNKPQPAVDVYLVVDNFSYRGMTKFFTSSLMKKLLTSDEKKYTQMRENIKLEYFDFSESLEKGNDIAIVFMDFELFKDIEESDEYESSDNKKLFAAEQIFHELYAHIKDYIENNNETVPQEESHGEYHGYKGLFSVKFKRKKDTPCDKFLNQAKKYQEKVSKEPK